MLRDVTLFYNEQHPELRAAESGPLAEDNMDDNHTQNETSARTLTLEMQKTPEKTDSTQKH